MTDRQEFDVHASAKGYQTTADAYERGRPGYSSLSVEALCSVLKIGRDSKVVEVGAGTGKFTRAILPICPNVIAVEPIPAMREKLSAWLPTDQILSGTAEVLALPSNTADAIIVANAFHWFDGELALKEFYRVLKPGGGLGLIWNRDGIFSSDWGEHIDRLLDGFAENTPQFQDGNWKKAFEKNSQFSPLQTKTFLTSREVTPDQIIDRVASISYVAALPQPEHQGFRRQVREILETHPSSIGKATLRAELEAHIYWCFKN